MVSTSDRFALWLTIGRGIVMLTMFVMPLVLTRCLTVSDYGVFSQFFTLYQVLYMMFAFGTQTNIFFFCPEGHEEKQGVYLGNTLLVLCALGVASALLLSLPPVAHALFGDSALSRYQLLVVLCIAFAVPINIVAPIYSVREDKAMAIAYPTVVALSRIVVIILVAAIWHDIRLIMMGMVVYQVMMTLVAVWYTRRVGRLSVEWSTLKRQMAYSLPFGAAVTLQLLSNYFDKIASVRLLSPENYAVYSVAFFSIPGINQIVDSLAQVNIINMSKCYQAHEFARIMPLYREFVRKVASFSTPVILCAALYSEEIVGLLFAKEYASAAVYFRIYSLTFLLSMFGAGTVLRSVGKTRLSMYAFIISCVIGLPLTVFLIQRYAVAGAITAAVINIILPRILQMIYEVRVMRATFASYLPWRQVGRVYGVALVLLVPLVAVKLWLAPGIIACIALAAVYVLAVYAVYVKDDLFIVSRETLRAHKLWK